jgi:hypothetical protein
MFLECLEAGMLNLLIEQASLRLPPGSRPIHGAFPEIQCGISLYIINQIANTLMTFSGSFLRNYLLGFKELAETDLLLSMDGTMAERAVKATHLQNFGVNAFQHASDLFVGQGFWSLTSNH